jgi:hypothetical protein
MIPDLFSLRQTMCNKLLEKLFRALTVTKNEKEMESPTTKLKLFFWASNAVETGGPAGIKKRCIRLNCNATEWE